MSVQYPQLTDAQIMSRDHERLPNLDKFGTLLKNMPHEIVSSVITAGASGVTVNDFIFVLPVKAEILKAEFIMTTVQTGTGNTPTVRLVEGSNVIGETDAIALSGAIGDVKALTLDAMKVVLAAGTKLIHRVVNPAGTITVAIQGKLQVIWKPVA